MNHYHKTTVFESPEIEIFIEMTLKTLPVFLACRFHSPKKGGYCSAFAPGEKECWINGGRA